MGRSQTTVCKTSQQPDQPWDVRFQMILVLFRLILIALHQLYVMLSEAKHLYRRKRDPSLPLRVTFCKVICVTKNSSWTLIADIPLVWILTIVTELFVGVNTCKSACHQD